jgi:iduronate 2-sulfatase
VNFLPALAALLPAPLLTAGERPNVLFIAIDDLRPWLGCQEPALVGVSPHIDRLASQGRLFTRHFVQAPTCGASRCALIFGRYPGHLPGDLGNDAIRKTAPHQPVPPLPRLFRDAGYRTEAIGKITHHPGGRTGRNWAEGPEELPGAWDHCHMPTGPWKTPEGAMHGYPHGRTRQQAGKDAAQRPVSQQAEGDDRSCPDGWVTDAAVARLETLTTAGQPFFLAVGILKPHLPFVAPASHFTATRALDPPPPASPAKPAFPALWHGSSEFRQYGPQLGDPFTDARAATAYRRAYLACIHYADAQVGKILAALDASPAAKHTVVVLWSDHGFLLGEHGIWGKHCLYEEALRSPLIVRLPDQPQRGEPCDAIVESIDLYPTLAELAGLQRPPALHGKSFLAQLRDPAVPTDSLAISYWGGRITLRSPSHRLIAPLKQPTQGAILFDRGNDPAETRDVAPTQADTLATLMRLLPPPAR